ncbi:MAG: hypothetical protein SGARI_006553, partial [Bacillariaceae sp.]
MVDCLSSTSSPTWDSNIQRLDNPFDYMPAKPSFHNRVNSETSKRLLSNLDTLSVPSFEASPGKRRKPLTLRLESTAQATPQFHAALQRMREGGALRRLQLERDAVTDTEKEEETLPLSGGDDNTVAKQPL